MAGDGREDYYALLGLDRDADARKLRTVWRRLALRWHPDRAGAHATGLFQKISAAYAVLSDPVLRAAYDRGQTAPTQSASQRRPPTEPVSTPRRRAPGAMLSRLSGPLNALLACGAARRESPELIELFLNPQEAAQGGMVAISMRVRVRCPSCEPAGSCAGCGGRGVEELFSAWLAISPGIRDGSLIDPSALLRGMIHPLRFRIRMRSRG
jgi:molecular chaperone DnaJ